MRPSPKSDPGSFTWLTVAADFTSLEPIRQFVLEAARAAARPEDQFAKLELVLEEIVVNVMRHAYPPGATGSVEVGCACDRPQHLCVQVRDTGKPFDPLSHPEVNLNVPLEERPFGKMGIFLVKRLAESISYQRTDGRNVLTFSIGPEPAGEE